MEDNNIILDIKTVDGVSFHGLKLHAFTYTSTMMSLDDKIEGDVFYPDTSLDFTMSEYVEYEGLKYYQKTMTPPTVTRKGMAGDNSDLKGMTKYSLIFYHPMADLYNIPFTDKAVSSDEKLYKSEDTSFYWIGTITQFMQKLNSCLYSTPWTCELQSGFVDDGTQSEVIQFDNQMISDALKKAYDTWKVPFVVSEHKIIFGKPSNEVLGEDGVTPFVFRMGQGMGLKDGNRTPKNNTVLTRCSGFGSSDNIPNGYPKIKWTGDPTCEYTVGNSPSAPNSYPIIDGVINGEAVRLIQHPFTRTHLMPSVYIASVKRKVDPFYTSSDLLPAGFNIDSQLIDYYDAIDDDTHTYSNHINPDLPIYEKHEFSDIKPSIIGATYMGQAIDVIRTVSPCDNSGNAVSEWDVSTDEKGDYRQSYFLIGFHPLGFDLYAMASVTSAMSVVMKSGACNACTFEISVDWDSVKSNFYVTDNDGNSVFTPKGSQRNYDLYPDSTDQSITVMVKKDTGTFGTLMPNLYQKLDSGNKFVFTGIDMPQVYIDNQQMALDEAIKEYLLENNIARFEYPDTFDEYFLATHPDISGQISTNSIVRIEYDGDILALSVKEIAITYGDTALPTYKITLTDDISVVSNAIGEVTDGLSKLGGIVAQLQTIYGKNILFEIADKLSRTKNDKALGQIDFKQGLTSGNYTDDVLIGTGAKIDNEGIGTFQSLVARGTISAAGFRYNYINANAGLAFLTNGIGLIDDVDIINNIITLKIEEGEYATISVGDICQGKYVDTENTHGEADGESDACGFPTKGGYFTTYFFVNKILTNEKGKCTFSYSLRNTSTPHPCKYMRFASYGSFTDTDRQSCIISNAIGKPYIEYLTGVNTWIVSSMNIVKRDGWLGGLTITLKNGSTYTLSGFGSYSQDNNYFGNAIIQLKPETLDSLKSELKNYTIDYSHYNDVITVDDIGNVIGGLWMESSYTDSSSIVHTCKEYLIHSAIYPRCNSKVITEAAEGEDAAEGTYKVYLYPHGCSCDYSNGTIYITAIDNIKDGVAGSGDDTGFDYAAMRAMNRAYVDIVVDCEGKGTITKVFPITIKHSSQPFIGADLSNEMASIAWDEKTKSYNGFPLETTLSIWHNNEPLVLSAIVVSSTIGLSATTNRTTGLITINVDGTQDGDFLGDVVNIDITASAIYAGVSYERTITLTINKMSDSNIYSLIPTLNSISLTYNNGIAELSSSVVACVVNCNSVKHESYNLTAAEMATRGLSIKYSMDDGAQSTYTLGTNIGVTVANESVTFYLYHSTLLIDKEIIPILANGQDGKGAQWIYALTTNNTPPTLTSAATDSDQFQEKGAYEGIEYIPSGWYDDPQSITPQYQYAWSSKRISINGVWQAFGSISVYEHYGKHAASLSLDNIVTVPTDAGGVTLADFSETIPIALKVNGESCSDLTINVSGSSYATKQGSNVVIHVPEGTAISTIKVSVSVTGKLENALYSDTEEITIIPNKDGADGDGYEYVYYLSSSPTAPTSAPTRLNGALTAGWNESVTQMDSVNRYIYVSFRQGKIGADATNFSMPKLFTYLAENGTDGEPGKSTFSINLVGDRMVVPCDSSSFPIEATVLQTQITGYYGVTPLVFGTDISLANSTITIGSDSITLESLHNFVSNNLVIEGAMAEDYFDLIISVNSTLVAINDIPISISLALSYDGMSVTLSKQINVISNKQGATGNQGGSGPFLIYRGEFVQGAGNTYYGNSGRVDAVKYNSLYYQTLTTANSFVDDASHLPTNTTYWKLFNGIFESIATNLLLAENANIADWIVKSGKITSQAARSDSVPRAKLNGTDGIITLASDISRYTSSGGTEPNVKQTIQIDSTTGEISVSTSDNEVATLTSQGILANKAGIQSLPAGTWELKAAVAALGNGNLAQSAYNNLGAICGVFGRANNSNANPAPSYGGYFFKLLALGLFLGCKQVSANYTVTQNDVFLSLYNTSVINITLPASPYNGEFKMLRFNNTTTTVNLSGNGHMLYLADGNLYASKAVGLRGELVFLIFDGQYWLYSTTSQS